MGIRIAAWIAIVAVIIYAVFVGAEASVVRAAVMATLMIFAATMLGRRAWLRPFSIPNNNRMLIGSGNSAKWR